MKKILVTGATGRMGSNLVKRLIELGYETRSFVRPNSPRMHRLDGLDTEIVYGELGDRDSISKALDGVDGVIYSGRSKSKDQDEFFDLNVKETYFSLKAACEHLNRIEKFVFISTNATYSCQNPKYQPIDENHPQNPTGLYGLTKMLSERIVEQCQSSTGLPCSIVRPGLTRLGSEFFREWTVARVRGIMKGASKPGRMTYTEIERPWEPLDKLGASEDDFLIPKGPDGRSWTHHLADVRDMVEGIIAALERPEAVGQAFNIMGPSPVSWAEVVKRIAEVKDTKYFECTLPSYWGYECDISKARDLLGFTPRHGAKDIVDAAVALEEGKDIGVIG